nr:MaoC family dehydratase [Pseudobdellovibrionaceae bacterium]
ITEEMVEDFARISGDRNPIHMDEEFAKTTRFKKRIAHGMLAGSFISRALNEAIGKGGVYLSQTLKFTNPIFIGETIHVNLRITAFREEKGFASVETIVTDDAGTVLVKGEAMLMAT